MSDYTKEIGFWKRLESFTSNIQTNCCSGEEEIVSACENTLWCEKQGKNNECVADYECGHKKQIELNTLCNE